MVSGPWFRSVLVVQYQKYLDQSLVFQVILSHSFYLRKQNNLLLNEEVNLQASDSLLFN